MYPHSIETREQASTPALLFFALLIIVEAAIFYTQVAIDVAPFYPPNHDQVNYLIDAYSLVSAMRESGIGAGMTKSLTWPGAIGIFVTSRGANGFLFPIQGALASVLLGVDRAGVLTINLLVFALLQIVVFRLVKWKTRRENDAWLAVALVLMLSSPFFFAGGIFDFRIDFFALCAMGIWASVVLRSGVFRSLRWSVIAGVAGGWLTCTRYISFVYLAPTLGVLLLAYGITWARATSRFRRATAWVRCRNIFISGLITTSCVAPLLLVNRGIIYKYYFVSRFVNAEKEIRANELRLHTLSDHLSFYPKSIVFDHLGKPALVAIGVLLLWCCLAARVWERPGRAALWQGIRSESKALCFLAATILVPLVFLNLSLSKSPVIGGILSIPVLLVVIVLMCAFRNDGVGRRTVPQSSRSWRPIQVNSSWFAGGFVVAAMIVFAYHAGRPKSGLSNVERATINEIYDKVIRDAMEKNNMSPSVFADGFADYLNAGVLMTRSYEHFERLIQFRQLFPRDVIASGREEAVELLARSDVVFLTDPLRGRGRPYPLDSAVQEYWPALRKAATANFIPLMSTTIRDVPVDVFVKPRP